MPAFCWNSSGQQMIDLNPHHLDLVRTTLRSHIPDSTVVAFGSRVKWTASGFSDLDLVVCDIKTLDFSTMGRLRDAFDESNLPIRVDVHDWNAIPDHFKPSIVDSYEVLVQGKRRFPPGETIESALESVRPTIESDADLRVLTIGSFAPFLYGKSLPARVRNEDGSVPVYGSNGIVGWHDQALTDGPTVIIGRKGTVGTVHYSDIPCWPIDTTFYVHGTDHSLIRYKYLLLSSLSLDKMNADSAVPGLNRNEAHATVVNVPDEAEQRRVARAMGSLDDRIELNRRMAATLEAMAQALFKSWFMDFDPVYAKMEGRHTGLPDHIAGLFPDRLADSPLGPIPEGWSVNNLDHCFRVVMGQSPPSSTYNLQGEGVPFYQGSSDFGFRFPSLRVYCTSPMRTAPAGSTLLSVRAPVGDLNLASHDCCIGRGIAALLHRSKSGSFTYYAMQQLASHLQQFEAVGTVFGAITKAQLASLKVVEPNETAVTIFHEFAGSLDKQIRLLTQHSAHIAEVREVVLPQLLNGSVQLLTRSIESSPL